MTSVAELLALVVRATWAFGGLLLVSKLGLITWWEITLLGWDQIEGTKILYQLPVFP